MPLQRRKPTVRGAIRDVLLAPFALILINLYVHRWMLAVLGACVLVCLLLGADFSADFLDEKFLVTCGMTVVVIAVAAIPLAIKDYFTGDGSGWEWAPSEECRQAAIRYAEMVLRNDVASLQPHLLPWLAASLDRSEMSAACATIVNEGAGPVAVRSAVDVPLAEGEPEDFDAIVQVIVDGVDQAPCGMLMFWIDAAGGQRIVSWHYWHYTNGDPQRASLIVQVAPRLDAAAV